MQVNALLLVRLMKMCVCHSNTSFLIFTDSCQRYQYNDCWTGWKMHSWACHRSEKEVPALCGILYSSYLGKIQGEEAYRPAAHEGGIRRCLRLREYNFFVENLCPDPNMFIVNFIFLKTTLDVIMEDLLEFLLDKNPSVKAETLALIARIFSKSTPTILTKKVLKMFCVAMLTVITSPITFKVDSILGCGHTSNFYPRTGLRALSMKTAFKMF